ncbi:MAG TPA: hypothetical protein ENN60_00900 [archaeon]|nr:hypothetical protein [archaeon]
MTPDEKELLDARFTTRHKEGRLSLSNKTYVPINNFKKYAEKHLPEDIYSYLAEVPEVRKGRVRKSSLLVQVLEILDHSYSCDWLDSLSGFYTDKHEVAKAVMKEAPNLLGQLKCVLESQRFCRDPEVSGKAVFERYDLVWEVVLPDLEKAETPDEVNKVMQKIYRDLERSGGLHKAFQNIYCNIRMNV